MFLLPQCRETLLNRVSYTSSKSNSNTLPLCIKLPYTPQIVALLPKIKNILKVTEYTLHDPLYHQVFGTRKSPLLCFSRATNLKEILTSSDLFSQDIPTQY